MHLAQNIMQNKQYSISTRADDDYAFDDGQSSKEGQKKPGTDDHKINQKNTGKTVFDLARTLPLFFGESKPAPASCCVNSKLDVSDVATVAACGAWPLLHFCHSAIISYKNR